MTQRHTISKFHSVYINRTTNLHQKSAYILSKFHSVYINRWSLNALERGEIDSKFHSVYINRIEYDHEYGRIPAQNSILFILIGEVY